MTARTTGRPAAPPLLQAGLAATALTAVAVVVDQAVIGSIRDRVTAVYAGHPGLDAGDAESFVVTILLTTVVLGTLGWLVALLGSRRRTRWAAPVGTALWVLGLGVAVTLMTVTEYGGTLVPAWLGLLGLLPSLVGLAATVSLWRDRRA
ncbi:hypothetical protein [Pseudonocardia parietis]|uniref:Peptidoglycan/LPS O-acetylase OafA/YrhL n=1 Tax=Pseudonocardia parietis TaxID=570936 RepID=A0ABS4VKJ5_9PSEU|nr:hypothetical protein [Pseudonocardia parietis]MBP2364447.1 peptidoglycan/LPS O-acetylase OafA/YrhL [Pseudonocardia parietis]